MPDDVDVVLSDPELLRERLELIENAAQAAAVRAAAAAERAEQAEARAEAAEKLVADLMATRTMRYLQPLRTVYGRARRVVGR